MSAPLLAPFRGWLIRPEWADRVIASATDSKTPEQRRAIVQSNPFSYFGVTRTPDDLPELESNAELTALSAQTFTRIVRSGAYQPSDHAAFYAYRMSSERDDESHKPFAQIGIVGALDVEGISDGRVLTHENIQPERTSLITDHLHNVGASASPVSLTHVAIPELQESLAAASRAEADIDVVVDGIRNQVWTLSSDDTSRIQSLLEDLVLFIADGHHRCAAAVESRDNHLGNSAFARTLAVMFPHDHLRVEAFHRRAPDQAARSTAELIKALSAAGTVVVSDSGEAARPTARGEVGVYHDRSWFRLILDPLENPTTLEALDVERVHREVIGQVLGCDELSEESQVDYVPERAGISDLTARCDDDGFVGLLLHPPDISDIMAVAAAGQLMPPKSSFIYPKAPSGVFLQVLGVGATEHLPAS